MTVKVFLFTALLLNIALTVSALYDQDPAVQSFENSKDFRQKVLENEGVSLIQFYAPWCGHCQQFQPVFSTIASLLKGFVTVGAIDASKQDGPLKRIVNNYQVTGFPTLKLFRGKNVTDISTRDPKEIVNLIMTAIQNTIQERAAGAGAGAGNTFNPRNSQGRFDGQEEKSLVKQLTAKNFHREVYENPQVVAVAFVAPWCGHCKALLPEWEIAASKLKKSGATLAVVDATVEESLAAQFGVQGYPTIKIFPGGQNNKSSPRDAMDYQGGRQAEQIVQYVMAEIDRSGVPKEIPELVNQDILSETCQGDGQNVICVLVALPHILETGAEGRNRLRNIMTAASKSVRGMSFEFLWFEGSAQSKLENALEMTFGFPAVVAYSMDKGVYAVHRGSFNEVNIRKFLMGITAGKQATYKIADVPTVVTVDPWDGKDGVPIEEEPLEDIMGWDEDDDNAKKEEL
jgi:protein disulfide-isomerase A6